MQAVYSAQRNDTVFVFSLSGKSAELCGTIDAETKVFSAEESKQRLFLKLGIG